MMIGIPEVETIMLPLREHIKPGNDEHNRKHYNYVYSAVYKLVQRVEELEAAMNECRDMICDECGACNGHLRTEPTCDCVAASRIAEALTQKGGD